MCIGTLFSCSTLFVDTHITPKWIFFFGGGFIFGICHITSVLQDNKYSKKIYYYHIIIVISLLIQAIYGILQFKGIFKSVNSFNATGSFDNPAGFATSLSLGIPLCIYLFIISKKIISRICICIIICTIISAIIIAESRTGILTVFSIFLYKFINSFKFSTLLKTISFILLTITIIIGLYHFKQDSANGRIFIWKCSIPMLQEKILKGHGKGGFEANYMKHQAKYFQLNPNSNYKWLADNIQHPFCEYIKITCDYGLIGLFSIFTSLFFLIYCYLKVPTLETETSILCLGSICILALFSYPLSYPFTWLIGLVSTYNLIKKFIHKQLKEEYSRILIRRLSLLPYVVLTLYIGYKTHLLLTTEIQWKDCANQALLRISKDKILPQYQCLEKKINNNRLFLYNYCNVLYQYQDYNRSLDIALKCRTLWSNYNLELLIGKIYHKLKNYNKAEFHYSIAHNMCPIRFLPLYELNCLYDEMGEKDKALYFAEIIITKQVKIPSTLIENIKIKMNYYISKHKNI